MDSSKPTLLMEIQVFFVNASELHDLDVLSLQKIIYVSQGRFWLDAKGNGGYEGYPASFNLVKLSRKAGRNSLYRNF